jgi:hypothetical protein
MTVLGTQASLLQVNLTIMISKCKKMRNKPTVAVLKIFSDINLERLRSITKILIRIVGDLQETLIRYLENTRHKITAMPRLYFGPP